MSEALKPCPVPWCNGQAFVNSEKCHHKELLFWVVCGQCGCKVSQKISEIYAIAAWNTRPNGAVIEAAQKVADLGRARGVAFLSTDIPVLHRIALELAALLPPKERS